MKKKSLAQATCSLFLIVALTITTFIISPKVAFAQVSCKSEECTTRTDAIASVCDSEACNALIQGIIFEDNNEIENAKDFYKRSVDKVLEKGRQEFEVVLAAKQGVANLNNDQDDKELVEVFEKLLFRSSCPLCSECGDCGTLRRKTPPGSIVDCVKCQP